MPRKGYTLIELLVTMALIMLIMAVLSTSFIVGLDTFGKLKALGDMSERLRAATTLMRRDLDADHFEGRIRLSDPALVSASIFHRPREGFVRVRQLQASQPEGLGADGVPSYRGAGHILHLAVKLRGNRPEDFFSTTVPAAPPSPLLQPTTTFFNQPTDARYQDAGSVYKCQWAEVAYFLQPLPNNWTANGTPLYSLHRIARLCVVDNRAANGGTNQVIIPWDPTLVSGANAPYLGVSARMGVKSNGAQYLHFNSPRDLSTAINRAIDVNNPVNLPNSIDTILLTDVVSFDVKILRAPPIPAPAGQAPTPFGYPLADAQGRPAPDFENVPDYDSANAPYPVLGIQVILRVWDLKTQQTRQITLIQDL